MMSTPEKRVSWKLNQGQISSLTYLLLVRFSKYVQSYVNDVDHLGKRNTPLQIYFEALSNLNN